MNRDLDPEALSDQALSAWEAEDFITAESLWTQAADLGSARAMTNLARNRIDDGDLKAAEMWFLRAVDRGSAEAAVWMGRIAHERGDEAEQEKWRWRAADLGDIPMILWLANRDRDPGENFNLALMTRAAELNSHKACAMLCVRANQRDEYDESIRWGERALATIDQEDNVEQLARFHAVLGASYYLTGRYEDALVQYDTALVIAPGAVEVDPELIDSLRREMNALARSQRLGKQSVLGGTLMGSSLTPPAQVSEVPNARYCASCGVPLEVVARFCVQCGAPVS